MVVLVVGSGFMNENPLLTAAGLAAIGEGVGSDGSGSVAVVVDSIMKENPLVAAGAAGAGSGTVGFKKEKDDTAGAGAAGAGSGSAPAFMKPKELIPAARAAGSGFGVGSGSSSAALDGVEPLSSRPPNMVLITGRVPLQYVMYDWNPSGKVTVDLRRTSRVCHSNGNTIFVDCSHPP